MATCVYLDERTLTALNDFSKERNISRSASIRFIVAEYFLKKATQ